MLAGLSLLAPLGLLVCLSALIPLGVLAVISSRQARAASAIGLAPARRRDGVPIAVATAAVCLLLGVAAAQPVLTTTETRSARAGSEIVFVVDISESMLASARSGSPTRLERARSAIRRIRLGVPDVPAGISGLTDRVLPFLFPTLDAEVFSSTLERSVQVDAPPPTVSYRVATTFEPLSTLSRNGFFSPATPRRTCVLVTDGESRTSGGEGALLQGKRGCRLVVVRIGGPKERIFTPAGRADALYRPEASAAETVARLAQSAGGADFDEGDVGAALAAVRAAAQVGPRRPAASAPSSHSLAPYLAGLALVLVAGIVVVRSWRTASRRLRPAAARIYDFRPEGRARRAG